MLTSLSDDPATYAASKLLVRRTSLPPSLRVHEELGRGTNNKVFRATLHGQDCVLRAPRRRSDTQQRGSALWEFRHTLKAAQLGVGPEVYDAWCARHACDRWPSGLYAITERFSYDLDKVLSDRTLRAKVLEKRELLADALVTCVATLAKEHIFVYDLKPSNVVLRVEEDGGVTAKIIDFGRDFCEWGGCDHPDSNTPCLTMLRKRLAARETNETKSDATHDGVLSHVLFAAMLVLLSSTTTYNLHEDRADHRMPAEERRRIHPLADRTATLLDSMQGRNVDLVRAVLRMDDVRGVLRHYHGRRNSGTRRTFHLARGLELA